MTSFHRVWSSIALDLNLLASDLLVAAHLFLLGFKDSINVFKIKEVIVKSKEIRSLIWKVFWLNAIIFVGSNALYYLVLTRFFDWLFKSESENVQLFVWWVKLAIDFFWNALWVFPVYVFSFIMSASWYDKIAEIVYKQFPQRLENRKQGDYTLTIAAQVQKVTLMWFFLLIGMLWSFVPYIGFLIAAIYSAWLYAVYCFEYRWTWLYPDRSPATHLLNMEYYYIYYCGFGFLFALFVGMFPTLIGGGIFAFLFPAFIIMAATASPSRSRTLRTTTMSGSTSMSSSTTSTAPRNLAVTFHILPDRVLIFKQANWLNDKILSVLLDQRFLQMITTGLRAILAIKSSISRLIPAAFKPQPVPVTRPNTNASNLAATGDVTRRRQRSSSVVPSSPIPSTAPAPSHSSTAETVPSEVPEPSSSSSSQAYVVAPSSSPDISNMSGSEIIKTLELSSLLSPDELDSLSSTS